MASSARIDELKKKFDENPRRYFAPLANEFRKGGDLEQAILICEEFLPHQPGHMSGHIVYGQTLFESDRLDDARSVFETALSLDPENLIALRHLGDIAGRQGDATGARRWYERVLEADPRNEEIQSLIANLDGAPSSRASSEQIEDDSPAYVEGRAEEHVHADSAAPYAGARSELEPIDLDATVPHGVPVVDDYPDVPEYGSVELPGADAQQSDTLGLSGIVPMPDTAQLMPDVASVADGFEATEFTAPETPIAQTAGLQSAFEDETGIYGAAPAARDESPASHASIEGSGLPELDGDDGLGLPPHGDPFADAVAEPPSAASELPMLDGGFELPTETATPAWSAPESDSFGSMDSMDSLESMELDESDPTPVPDAADAGTALPLELPPEVIAAEAELVESGMSMEQPATDAASDTGDRFEESDSSGSELTYLETAETEPIETETAAPIEDAAEPEAVPSHRPFVTETMAELYLTQGFRDQALQVYEQLSAASPHDTRLAEKLASLRATPPAAAPASEGPTVREFFARLAARRPGTASAQATPPDRSDFAAPETHTSTPDSFKASDHEPELADTYDSPASDASASDALPEEQVQEHAYSEAPSGGTIDALFGNKPTGATEDSAASALAQAFGSGTTAPPITGRPARPASGELSLDSVFRDGPSRAARTSQGFSFDQFFSQNPEGENTGGTSRASQELPPPDGAPAEKSADDIEQFNSWLQGLKNR